MKHITRKLLNHCLPALALVVLTTGVALAQQTAALAPPVTSPAEKAAIEAFENQVKDYVKLRNKVKEQAPKLSKDSTPEQIQAYRTALEDSMRAARKGGSQT